MKWRLKSSIRPLKENIERFPDDFMFQLTSEEMSALQSQTITDHTVRSRSQIVTLNSRGHNIKYLPYAFTEQGVAMLSSVLRSGKAVKMNIAIMRAFVEMRKLSIEPFDLTMYLQQLAKRVSEIHEGYPRF